MQQDLTNHKYVVHLRHNQTEEEIKFYWLLRRCIKENFPELQVGKQVPIKHPRGFYIIDFYIGSIKLGFEIDGGYHWNSKQLNKDLKRDHFLENEKNIILHHIPNIDIIKKGLRKKLKIKLIAWIKKRKIIAKRVKIKKAAIKHGWRKIY